MPRPPGAWSSRTSGWAIATARTIKSGPAVVRGELWVFYHADAHVPGLRLGASVYTDLTYKGEDEGVTFGALISIKLGGPTFTY